MADNLSRGSRHIFKLHTNAHCIADIKFASDFCLIAFIFTPVFRNLQQYSIGAAHSHE